MKTTRDHMPKWKMQARYWLPLVLGGVSALIHIILIAEILLSSPNGGIWSEVLAFTIDFPISIAFVWLSRYMSLVLLHMTLGSIWWFAIVWALVRGLMWITDHIGRNAHKNRVLKRPI